jgi:hypothetical protein
MPLLAVALLHHQKLGAASPLSSYIRVLESSDIHSMPFLWSNTRLKQEMSPGVRTVARGIQQEIRDMYDSVVQVLIREHPDLFGPVTNTNINTNTSEEKKWMFSFEHFQWAFAMVNSRHWQLPIVDLERPEAAASASAATSKEAVDEQNPPADMPTDIWTQEHGDAIGGKEKKAANSHSFLAPVADLLNFRPLYHGSAKCRITRLRLSPARSEKAKEVTFGTVTSVTILLPARTASPSMVNVPRRKTGALPPGMEGKDRS